MEDLGARIWQGRPRRGQSYSAFSRVASSLGASGRLDKRPYRPAPDGYGSHKIRRWAESAPAFRVPDFPEELPAPDTITEGAKRTVVVNKYERSRSAKRKCIRKWGVECIVCAFNFQARYGERGSGYIHVHHLIPLYEIGESYELDPINDLCPICPNCHAMIHRSVPPLSIDELKVLLNAREET